VAALGRAAFDLGRHTGHRLDVLDQLARDLPVLHRPGRDLPTVERWLADVVS